MRFRQCKCGERRIGDRVFGLPQESGQRIEGEILDIAQGGILDEVWALLLIKAEIQVSAFPEFWSTQEN